MPDSPGFGQGPNLEPEGLPVVQPVQDALARLRRHFERVAVELPHVAASFNEDLSRVEQALAEQDRELARLSELSERQATNIAALYRQRRKAESEAARLREERDALRDGLRRMEPMSRWSWWQQYENTAKSLDLWREAHNQGTPEFALLVTAADDIRTLVDGLKQHEREVCALLAAREGEAG